MRAVPVRMREKGMREKKEGVAVCCSVLQCVAVCCSVSEFRSDARCACENEREGNEREERRWWIVMKIGRAHV